MVRSPHPAKPFHFGPFVSLQLLIFMIAHPDITPTSGPDLTAAPTAGTKWTGLKNKVGRLERQRQTARYHCMERKKMMRTKRKRKTERTRTETRKITIRDGTPLRLKKSNDSHIIFCSQKCRLLSFCPQLNAFL